MRTSEKYTLGFIGCGHMGLAIAKGAVAHEYLERRDICVYDPKEEVSAVCAGEGFAVMPTMKEAAENCHIVVLAVTPQVCDSVLEELSKCRVNCILSIVTGVSIRHLQEMMGSEIPIVRAMPNTPLQIGEGATALCRSESCPADEYDFVFRLFRHLGVTRTVPEEQLNAFVSVHGSTPAYIYYFAECIINDMTKRGIDEETARALLVQTIIGSGKLLKENPGKPLSSFIDEVCSKGGTTIQAIESLKNDDLAEIVRKANEKCIARAEELGR
ncbi:MAG: pyrroline-5-carboxylate reductase [Solobacterium sp.]|nr:pyrroline-5-carboxylate reductase [Solobacterium sp.]